MPKSTKRFVLSDSSVNKYGFRVLTSGVDMSQFLKNPIMLFMHTRPFSNEEDQVLAIGHWEDIEVADDVISAVPVFDEDDFSMKIYNKVENGTYRMASAGLDPREFSEEPAMMLAGQRLPTVVKSVMEEASICDIGVNNNSLAFTKNGKLITLTSDNLSEFIPTTKKPNMEINLSSLKKTLNLADDASNESVVGEAITRLSELKTLKDKNVELADKLTAIEKDRKNEKISRMVSDAVAAGKITESQKPFYIKLAEGNLETTQELLGSMKAYTSVKDQLEKPEKTVEDKLLKMSWDELDKSGKLADLKAGNPEAYKDKFKEKFGKEPQL